MRFRPCQRRLRRLPGLVRPVSRCDSLGLSEEDAARPDLLPSEPTAGPVHNALSRIETGQVSPRLSNIEKIAGALGLSTEELQFRKPPVAQSGAEAPDVEALAARLASLDETRRQAVLTAFNILLDQIGGL